MQFSGSNSGNGRIRKSVIEPHEYRREGYYDPYWIIPDGHCRDCKTTVKPIYNHFADDYECQECHNPMSEEWHSALRIERLNLEARRMAYDQKRKEQQREFLNSRLGKSWISDE